MGARASYHEALLHWIWENRQLSGRPIQTQAGKKIIIHHPGTPNLTDGPDFKNAKITIANLTWYGDVEIHWKATDWFCHNHHTDANYKGVILHVIFDRDDVSPKQKPALPTLALKPYLRKPLNIFLERFRNDGSLPCAANLNYISHEALEQQIVKAHGQYFEHKVNDLIKFYNPEIEPSKAWQKLVIIAFFDGLGISHNRKPMRKLAKRLLSKNRANLSLHSLKKFALREAGIPPNKNNRSFNWKRKGSRPANHPKPRILQGCELLRYITGTPFEAWFNTNIFQTFEQCTQAVTCRPGLGKKRANILFGTVWLPAIYILGDLFGSKKLAIAAQKGWFEHQTSLPESITRPFRRTNVPSSIYCKKLGAVYQLRTYCRARQCHRCEVFKHAINP